MINTKKTYLDNIRWITVVLVVVYHVIYMYNGVEVAGVIGPFAPVQPQDAFQYIVYPWFMLLLFVISGICARYELEHRDAKAFMKRRTVRYLVPSTLALPVFGWMTGYFNTAIAGAFDLMPTEMPGFVRFIIMSLSGIGPLWYIQLLWVFSAVLLLVRSIEKDRLYHMCGKTGITALLAMTFLVWGAAQVLNTPIVTVYRFGIYGFGFMVGYFCLSHDEVVERLANHRRWLSMAAIILCIAFVFCYWQQPYAEAVVLQTFLCNVYAWVAVLAILGVMSVHGGFETPFSRFMNQRSWGLYLFHYLPLAMTAFLLRKYAPDMAPLFCYLLTALAAFIGSFVLDMVISRIPVLRWVIMGLGRTKKEKERVCG